MKQPLQPLYMAGTVIRFHPNAVVQHLLDHGGLSLNDLAEVDLPREDMEQFAQLIGYSLSGFGDLSYVSDDTYEAARLSYQKECTEQEARIEYLESRLACVRKHFKELVPELFHIHPDDLQE